MSGCDDGQDDRGGETRATQTLEMDAKGRSRPHRLWKQGVCSRTCGRSHCRESPSRCQNARRGRQTSHSRRQYPCPSQASTSPRPNPTMTSSRACLDRGRLGPQRAQHRCNCDNSCTCWRSRQHRCRRRSRASETARSASCLLVSPQPKKNEAKVTGPDAHLVDAGSAWGAGTSGQRRAADRPRRRGECVFPVPVCSVTFAPA